MSIRGRGVGLRGSLGGLVENRQGGGSGFLGVVFFCQWIAFIETRFLMDAWWFGNAFEYLTSSFKNLKY